MGERSYAAVCGANRGSNSPSKEVQAGHVATIAPEPADALRSAQQPAGKETKMRSTPIYEVHAVKYAHLPRKAWEVQITPDPHDADFNAQVGKGRGREVKKNPADL